MSHELTIRADDRVEMAYVGDTPWHGLGQKLPDDATIEDWVHGAGMEWEVKHTPVFFDVGEGLMRPFDEREVLYRSDTLAPLGVVSKSYCIIQPRECIEFFDDLVHSVGLSLETAGTMFGGRRFWALAKIGDASLINNEDKVRGYLLLTSSADGMRATEARFTSVRVVCRNTLRMSDLQDSEGQIKITHRAEWDPDEVKRQLGVAPATFETFMHNMRRLADVRVTDDKAVALTRKLFRPEQKDGEKKDGKPFEQVMSLFRGLATGFDLPGFEGTAWGWLNSVTEYVDHETKAKSESHRLQNSLMGPGEKLKSAALHQALELAA
jgi:phage/plasmid-like protein (TIGR03299 family)